MRELEKLEANERREEQVRKQKFCAVCGAPLRWGHPQWAHRIPKTKYFLRKYGDEVINHQKNLVLVCSLYCNGKVNIQNHPLEIEKLVKEIRETIIEEGKNA